MPDIFDQIDALIAEFHALQALKPEDQKRLDKKFRLEFNYNSNHMEGNTLTYGETALLLFFDDAEGNHTLREYEEMKAHDVAYALIADWAADGERPLTEQDIKILNQTILVRPFWKDAVTPEGHQTRQQIQVGNYKEFPNSVRLNNGEIFEYASPIDTPILMHELLEWYRSEESGLHPLILAAMLHYKFVSIHPFDDGNGRIARLLMNYVLLKNGLPPLIIKSKDKPNYFRALHQADLGDYTSFIEYIAKELRWSLEISTKAAQGETIDEISDIDKELHILQKELKSENIISIEANANIILTEIQSNVFPMLITLEEKLQAVQDVFFDMYRHLQYNVSGKEVGFTLGTKDSSWDQLKDNWLQNQILRNEIEINYFYYSYTLEGLRKSIAADSILLEVEFYFNAYNYIVRTGKNNAKRTTIPYGKRLTSFEIVEIISPEISRAISQIKALSAKTNIAPL